MSIQVGEHLPEATLNTLNNGVQSLSVRDIFAGKKVVLFAVPGAFTPHMFGQASARFCRASGCD